MSQKNLADVLNEMADTQPVPAVRLPDGTYITISLAREIAKTVLTWEDIKRIIKIADDLIPCTPFASVSEQIFADEFQTEESYYGEILGRYREGLK